MPPSCCRCCPAALHHPACGWWGACSSLVGGAAGQDRGERRAGGRRAVSTVPEARHPGPAGRRDCSSALSHACFGLRRSATSGALFCPHCRPAPGTHRPSCAQVGLRRGACDLPPALSPPAVGPRAQRGRGVAVYESLSTRCPVHACKMALFAQLERVGDLGRDKRLTSRRSVERDAVRRGGDLVLALGEPCVRGCRGSGDPKPWWSADPRM